jgi:hypothetical protein
LKIHEVEATGGGTNIDFHVVVQNVGTKPMRYHVTARVVGTPVQVLDPTVDLLPNTPPTTVQIRVPRPDLGDLVKEFNNETTLYGEELVVEVADENAPRGKSGASAASACRALTLTVSVVVCRVASKRLGCSARPTGLASSRRVGPRSPTS